MSVLFTVPVPVFTIHTWWMLVRVLTALSHCSVFLCDVYKRIEAFVLCAGGVTSAASHMPAQKTWWGGSL